MKTTNNEDETMTHNTYAVVTAPGCHGDHASCLLVTDDYEKASRMARRTTRLRVIDGESLEKGVKVLAFIIDAEPSVGTSWM